MRAGSRAEAPTSRARLRSVGGTLGQERAKEGIYARCVRRVERRRGGRVLADLGQPADRGGIDPVAATCQSRQELLGGTASPGIGAVIVVRLEVALLDREASVLASTASWVAARSSFWARQRAKRALRSRAAALASGTLL